MSQEALEQLACRRGFDAWGNRGPMAAAGNYGYQDARLVWCWHTGFEAARTGQGLSKAYKTLRMRHG